MKKTVPESSSKNFELEMLEPRILLSVGATAPVETVSAANSVVIVTEEASVPPQEATSHPGGLPIEPEKAVASIIAGIHVEELDRHGSTEKRPGLDSSADVPESGQSTGSKEGVYPEAQAILATDEGLSLSSVPGYSILEDHVLELPVSVAMAVWPIISYPEHGPFQRSLELQAENPDLIPNQSWVVGTAKAGTYSGFVSVTPAANANGTTTGHLSVIYGTVTPTQFRILVTPVNDAPSVEGFPSSMEIKEDSPEVSIDLTSISRGAPNESGQTLQISAISNNRSLIPDPLVDYSGTGSTGKLRFKPTPDLSGTAVITLTLRDNGGTLNGGSDVIQKTLTVQVLSVNDPPVVTVLTETKLPINSPPQTYPFSWIPGPANELAQSVSINFVSDNPDLVPNPILKSVGNSWVASIEPNSNATGTAKITVTAKDSGGIANGGQDTVQYSFLVTVVPVNRAPTLNPIAPVSLWQRGAEVTVPLSGITAGTGDVNQNLSISAISSNPAVIGNPEVVYLNPSDTGLLRIRPAADAIGTATITVTVKDTGGTEFSGVDTFTQTFVVNVKPVNQPPSFVRGPDISVTEDSGVYSDTFGPTVVGWGSDDVRQATPPDGVDDLIAISTGGQHTLGLRSDRTIAVWGAGPSPPGGLRDVAAISAGSNHDLALLANGTVLSWGSAIPPPAGLQNVIAIAAGNDSSLALRSDGTVIGWGANRYGEATPPNDLSDVIAISISYGNGLALRKNGTVVSWGWNRDGQNDVPAGLSEVVAISSGYGYNLALRRDGTIVGWGNNMTDGQFTGQATPPAGLSGVIAIAAGQNVSRALLQDGRVVAWGDVKSPLAHVPPNLNSVVAISEGVALHSVVLRGWASKISPGPVNEANQRLSFVLENNRPDLFLVQPSLSSSGRLAFTAAPNMSGSAFVTVRLVDSGGTADNGSDTSEAQTFTITIQPSNDPPTLNAIPDQTVNEDSDWSTLSLWGISAGPGEADQKISFSVTSSNPSIIPAPTLGTLGPDGTLKLSYKPLPDAFGVMTITVTVRDEPGVGQTAAELSQSFNVTVVAVNDAPIFTAGPNITAWEDGGIQTISNWATGIAAGPPNEAGQTLKFIVSTNRPELFSVAPSVSPSGTLQFKPADDVFGTAAVRLFLQDDAGSTSGGVDSSEAQTFSIEILGVNDAPTIGPLENRMILEDGDFLLIPLTGISAGNPPNEAGQRINITATSSDPLVVPNPEVIYAGEATGALKVRALPDANGEVTISVKVSDDGGVTGGGVDNVTRTFKVTVQSLNDAPTLGPIGNITILEDADWTEIPLTGISAGPANESGQTLTFEVSSSDPSIVSELEVKYSGGDRGSLRFKPAADANGLVRVRLKLSDNGGSSEGEFNSVTQDFTVNILAVNDAPKIAPIGRVYLGQDAGELTVPLAGIRAGPPDEAGQKLTVTASSSNTDVVSPPVVDYSSPGESGELRLRVVSGAHGKTLVSVTVQDDAGEKTTIAFEVRVEAEPVVISWADPADIAYGTSLGAEQLNARANVAGTFIYEQPVGTILHAGSDQPLTVTFYADDLDAHPDPITKSVQIDVLKRNLIAKATDIQATTGEPLKFRWTFDGFVNGDTKTSTALDTQISATTVPADTSHEGMYSILLHGPAETSDYTLVYRAGTLHVVAQPTNLLSIDVTASVRLNVGKVTPIASPLPDGPIAIGTEVELEFHTGGTGPRFSFETVDLYKDLDSSTFNGFVLRISGRTGPPVVSIGTGFGSDFLELHGSGIAASVLQKRNEIASGALVLTSDSAILFPGEVNFGGAISKGTSAGPGLTATYEAAGDRWVADAKIVTVQAKGIFTATAKDTRLIARLGNATETQTLATIAEVEVALNALGDAVIAGQSLVIRSDGFSLAAVPTQKRDYELGGFLKLSRATLQLANINYAVGSAPTGIAKIEAEAAQIFNSSNFGGTVTDGADSDPWAVVGTFDLPQQKLTLALDELGLIVPKILDLQGEGITATYVINGGSNQTLAAIPSADLRFFGSSKSPVQARDIVIRTNGFSLSNATFTPGEAAIADFMEVKAATISLRDINFTIGAAAQGVIEMSAEAATIFPGHSFSSQLKDGPDPDRLALQGVFDLGQRLFTMRIDQFAWSVQGVLEAAVPEGLTFSYGVDLPREQELLKIPSLMVTFIALGNSTMRVSGISIRQNGISIEAGESDPQDVTAGGFIELKQLTLKLQNWNYILNEGGSESVTGQVVLSATQARLFPRSKFGVVISDGNDSDAWALTGALNLEDRTITAAADVIDLTVPGVLKVRTSRLTMRYAVDGPADQELMRASLVAVTWSALEDTQLVVRSLSIRKNGFSFADASQNMPTLTIGHFLKISTPVLSVRGMNYTVDGPVTGSMTFSSNAAEVFPNDPSTGVILRDGDDADSAVINGQFDFGTETFSMRVDTTEITAQNSILITLKNVEFRYALNGGASQTVLSVDEAGVVVAQWQIEGIARGLEITLDGRFSVTSLTLKSQGIARTFGIAELLPFEITEIAIRFHGDSNQNGLRDAGEIFSLAAFDLRVTGYFNFTKMSDLPFTPIIRIGDPGTQRVFEKVTDTFDFAVSVVNGRVRPKDLGPIEIQVVGMKVGKTIQLSGTIRLGGYRNGAWQDNYAGSLTLEVSPAIKNVTGKSSVAIGGGFNGELGELTLIALFPVSFTLGGKIEVKNAELALEMIANAGAGSAVKVRSLKLLAAAIERVEINLGSLLKLTATNVQLDFNPTAAGNIAEFGSITASLPFLGFTGTAEHFAIGEDGSLKAMPGFAVRFKLEKSQVPSLKWPGWLRIDVPDLAIIWPSFNANPDRFLAKLSAIVEGLENLPLKVEGSITGAEIDLALLRQGKFPIVALEAAFLSVKGPLFGGQLEGSLGVGILRLDANGNQIAETDLATPVAQRIFYGGITAGFSFSGLKGFKIRIGLSDRGPLSVYVLAEIPVLLDPVSGLTISDFRAGVTFYTVLPSITDPLALRGNAFRAQSEMSETQWWTMLQGAVINQSRAPPGSGFWDAFSRAMKIEGGATLYSQYLTKAMYRADIDIILSTDGKFLAKSRTTYFSTLHVTEMLYADLSQLRDGKGAILYLNDAPAEHPVITIRGSLVFEFVRRDGSIISQDNQADTFHLKLSGGIDAQASSAAQATLEGAIEVSFESSRIDLGFAGQIKVTVLGESATLLGAAGSLHLKTGVVQELWGTLALSANLDFLEKVGIRIGGIQIFTLNLSGEDQTETLNLRGLASAIFLKAHSIGFFVQGTLQFRQGATDWFLLVGAFGMEISADGSLAVAAEGRLELRAGGSSLLNFEFTGFFEIRPQGVAALVQIKLTQNLPSGFDAQLDLDGSATFMLNTVGKAVTYYLPVAVGGGSSRTITVPGGPPGSSNKPYLLISAKATIRVISLRIQGAFDMLVTPDMLQMQLAGRMDLKAGGATIFSFDVAGGFLINSRGVAAAVSLGLRAGPAENLGIEFSGSYRLEVNTTGEELQLASVTLAAGRYARIRVDGRLYTLGLQLEGFFQITVGSDLINIQAEASFELRAGFISLATFRVRGGFQLDSKGFAGVIQLELAASSASSSSRAELAFSSKSIRLVSFGNSRRLALHSCLKGTGELHCKGISISLDCGSAASTFSPAPTVMSGLRPTRQWNGVSAGLLCLGLQ